MMSLRRGDPLLVQESLRAKFGPLQPVNGAWYETLDGESVADLSGQTLNLVDGQPSSFVIEAVKLQIDTQVFTSSRFENPKLLALANALGRISPPQIKHVNLKLTNGSDAIETALKIGGLYCRSSNVIALCGAWHGETADALSLSRRTRSRYLQSGRNVSFTKDPTLGSLVEAVNSEHRPCTVILDPLGVSNGLFDTNSLAELLRALEQSARKHGHFLVFDEIQSYGGFLGEANFIYDLFGVEADAIALGKAFGGGFPLAACLYTGRVGDLLRYNEAEFTNGGQPPACAAAEAFIGQTECEKPTRIQASKRFKMFAQRLLSDIEEYYEIRSIGFFLSITSKSHFPRTAIDALYKELLSQKVVTRIVNGGGTLLVKGPISWPSELESFVTPVIISAALKVARSFEAGTWDQHRPQSDSCEPITARTSSSFQDHAGGLAVNRRTLLEQTALSKQLWRVGVLVTEQVVHDGNFLEVSTQGASVCAALQLSGASEGMSRAILCQAVDYLIKAHGESVSLGVALYRNVKWDGSSLTLSNFSLRFSGRSQEIARLENLLCIAHYGSLMSDPEVQINVLRPFIYELDERHKGITTEDLLAVTEIAASLDLFLDNAVLQLIREIALASGCGSRQ